jgi:ABC-type multidrug transport system ATPase subunit
MSATAVAAPATSAEAAAIIRTEALTKSYDGADFAAVDELDLTVREGEIFGLLGPNGAGKTTTAGMLTTRVIPSSGKAFVGPIDVIAHPALAKQLIGTVYQTNMLDRQLTVWENLYFHGLSSATASGSRSGSRTSCSSNSGWRSGQRHRCTPCPAGWRSG